MKRMVREKKYCIEDYIVVLEYKNIKGYYNYDERVKFD